MFRGLADLPKEFDTANHSFSLKTLYYYSVTKQNLKQFASVFQVTNDYPRIREYFFTNNNNLKLYIFKSKILKQDVKFINNLFLSF